MSRNAIAFIAGLGTGMIKQREREKDDARQAKKDAQDDALFTANMDDINQKKKERDALAEAGKPIVVNANAATLDTSGKPVVYEDPGVASSDFRQARNMAQQTGSPMVGSAPQQTVTAGGKQYQDQASAQTAADAANTPAGRAQRSAAALYGVGKPVEAMQLEAGAKTAQVADITLADTKWRNDLGVAMQGGHDGIAALGTQSQAGILSGRTLKAVRNGDGTVTYNRVDPDGTLVPDPRLTFPDTEDGVVKAAFTLDKLITPKDRMTHLLEAQKVAKADKRADREEVRKDADSAAKNNYYNSLSGKNDAIANGEIGPGGRGAKSTYERMDELDKTRLTSINKQREKIQEAIIKGSADGSYDPTSPGAKNLQTQLALLSKQERELAAKYSDGGAAPDPLGVRKPAPQGGGATAAAPSSKRGGQVEILDQEWGKAQANLNAAKTPEEQVRAQGDLDALTREYGYLKAKPPVRPAAAAPPLAAAAGVPSVSAKPKPAPDTPAAPAVKSDLPPQAEAAGVALDQARAALKAISQQARPGLAAGRAAMDAYAEKLKAAKAEVAKRQADYERAIPAQGVAFPAQK